MMSSTEQQSDGTFELSELLSDNIRYKLTGAEFDLEFSAPKATTRQELGKILEELASGLQAEAVPDPDFF